MPLKSEKRAAASRANGAKSNGPKTPAGLFRCQTARYDHGLYATRVVTLPGEATEHYEDIRARLLETWAPSGFHAEALVHQLLDVLWEITRVKAVKTDIILEQRDEIARRDPSLKDPLKLNLAAEAAAGLLEKFQRADSRLSRYARERERLERELYRVRKEGLVGGSSQMSLIINDRRDAVEGSVAELPYVVEPVEPETEPEPDPEPEPEQPVEILAWAKENLDFELLSDGDEALCKLFDVIREKTMYGRKVMGIERSTFLIGADGVLLREWRKVKADGHAAEVLEAVKAL